MNYGICVRKCSEVFGLARSQNADTLHRFGTMCSEVFGSVRKCSDSVLGQKMTFAHFCYILIYLDFPALFYTDLNCFCYFDAFQAHYERFLPKSQKND